MRRVHVLRCAAAVAGIVALALASWIKARPGAAGVEQRIAHAPPVRALRCAGTPHVRLTGLQGWRVRYVSVGYGAEQAVVAIDIGADGRARLAGDPGTREVKLTGEEVAGLAGLIDATDLSCATPVPRARERPAGRYRRSLAISAPGYARTLTVDMCYTVNDELAWGEVTQAMESLLARLVPGHPTDARPTGHGSLAAACRDGQLLAVGEIDRTEHLLYPPAGR